MLSRRLACLLALTAGLLTACQSGPPPLEPVASAPEASGLALRQTLVIGLHTLAAADAVAALVGGTVVAQLPELGAVLLRLDGPRPDPIASALALTGHPDVLYASAQSEAGTGGALQLPRAPALQTQAVGQVIDSLPQYSLDANHLNARAAWQAGLRGAGVVVGIVDAPADVRHPDLAARWTGRAYDPALDREYTSASAWTAAVAGMTAAGAADSGGASVLGQGTAVASAAVAAQNATGMVGAAPDARFVTSAVFQPNFVGSFAAARAIVWTVQAGAEVIDLSWSSLGYDPLIKAATDYALGRGVTVVAAAGNGGRLERQQPAMYPGVLSSVAGDLAGQRAIFSSFGSQPTPITPGLDLLLASSDWTGTPGYALYSGTSFSSALLAGGAALLLGADPALDPYQVRSLLGAAAAGGPLDLARLPTLLATARPPAAAEARLSLKVRTASGDVPALLGDVTLLSTDPAGPVYLAQTDTQGEARFSAVEPGSYRVLAAAPDLSITGGAASERGSQSGTLTLQSGVVTAQTLTLDRGAVDLHPLDPYEPNDSADTAAALKYGERTALAYIAGKPRDLDFYAFQGQAGDRVRAGISARGDPSVGGQLDSVLVLRDGSGQILGFDDDFTNADSRLEATLPTNGRYTLEVSSFRILGPSEGSDPALGMPDDSPFNRYRLGLELLNSP